MAGIRTAGRPAGQRNASQRHSLRCAEILRFILSPLFVFMQFGRHIYLAHDLHEATVKMDAQIWDQIFHGQYE